MSNARPARRGALRPKLIALSVAACFSVSATHSAANPTGGTVSSGSASFASSGNTLTITNSANAIINWQNFSIGVNEITRFLQSSGSSAVLNRVVGANGVVPKSVIDGILSSNGRVFLLNSSGIAIGATARIDVAGFVASSLKLSDADFLTGKMRFTETPGAGSVSNAGVIDTTSGGPGGRVFLIAPDVQNSGIIRSPQGEIILAAGKSVELVSENSPFVTVNITADNERALNVGQLLADSGRIGMFGALVRQGGVAEANSAVVGANGEIRLVATKDLTLDAGSRTTANGPSGGSVTLQAQGGTNLIYGTVEAKGGAGQGGTIEALGVRVGVLGHGVIDASGDAGGGTVLVGGDAHGANSNVQNAQQTLIGPDGVIRADAATTGDGGRVIVWSDTYTQVHGTVSARGGLQSGNGGFIETSSAGAMDLSGVRVDTRAPNGRWGTWLLDPTNVYLEANTYAGGGDPLTYAATFSTNPGTDTHIIEATVESGFNTNGIVRIQATNDVNFRTNLNLQYGTPNAGLFEVRAQNNINLAADGTAHTISTNGQNVVLSANDIGPYGAAPGLNTASGTGSIIGGGSILTDYGGAPGGSITLSGYGVNVGTLRTIGGVDPNGGPLGSVTITALYGGVTTGNITTRGANGSDFVAAQFLPPKSGIAGGAVSVTAGYGTIKTGNIDTTGGYGGNGGAVTGEAYAGAAGGAGGAVTLGTTTYGATASITTGTITTTGGTGGYGGSGATVIATAQSLDEGSGGSGGSGGNIALSAGVVNAGVIKTSGGAGGAGGNNIYATLTGVSSVTSSSGFLTVGFGGSGGAAGSFNVNSNGANLGPIIATGGAGGAAGSGNTSIVVVNAVVGNTQVSGEADSGFGGSGGSGGQVTLGVMGPNSVAGSIDTSGGTGALGGANSVAKTGLYGAAIAASVFAAARAGEGGGGNGAGVVGIGGSSVSTQAITAASGKGGAGGSNSNASAYASSLVPVTSSFQSTAEAGLGGGGAGGSGTRVQLSGGDITTGAITTTGGAGGAGGAGSTATASGYAVSSFVSTDFNANGLGGTGGSVIVSAGTGNINIASITTSGDGSGSVSISNQTGDITTGTIVTRSLSPAFAGGGVSITTSYGRIFVNGDIDARGSDGLDTFIDTCGDGCRGATYGGSAGGSVVLTRNGAGDPAGGIAVQVSGSILASGGNGIASPGAGGAGGNGGAVGITSVYGGAFYGAVIVGLIDAHAGNGAGGATGFSGGLGGLGGTVGVSGASIQVGGIDASGGSGGAAGASGANGPGASGTGGNAGNIALSAYGNVTAGNITATGGAGGNGAATTLVAGLGSAGGYGGIGGTFAVNTNLVPTAAVTTGAINVSGGTGGKGGDSPTGVGGAGGLGGGSGTVIIDPNSAMIGPITGAGGAGGAGGYGGVTGGVGGSGGLGAAVTILGIAYGGTIAVGTIDVSGGAGGNGGGSGGAATYGGLGGLGGAGGSFDVLGGAIDLTAASSIKAGGGAGGAGGSGTAGFGGTGGAGGAGGLVNLSAQGGASGYGSIFVVSALSADVSGGLGGAGGATGGLSGASGPNGSTSIFGDITIASPSLGLDGGAVIQGTNQLALANTAPSTEDTQKKNEDNKKKNQAAACK
jgi:filamentous hemagglutinin family protein